MLTVATKYLGFVTLYATDVEKKFYATTKLYR